MSQRRRRKNRSEPSTAESPKIKKSLSFWVWLTFTALLWLYLIFIEAPALAENVKFYGKLGGFSEDVTAEIFRERLLKEVVAGGILVPILIAGAWKVLKWFIKQHKIASDQLKRNNSLDK